MEIVSLLGADELDESFFSLLSRVHGDVFRQPQKGMLLSVLIGNGVQITIMSLITLSKVCVY
jgi:hypothetical protein